MQIIISTSLPSEERKNVIRNYLAIAVMDLYNYCKKSTCLDSQAKAEISGSLCIAYMESKYKDYINITTKQYGEFYNSNQAIFNFEPKDDDALIVADLAKALRHEDAEESSC